MKVKLAEGRLLRDKKSHALMKPDEVREVPDNDVYWRRRLRDGDVVQVDGEKPAPAHHGHRQAKES